MRQLDLEGRFLEGPRWRDGRWWVSDMTDRAVYCLDTAGRIVRELALDDRPSGLGWLPDGALIVVGMDSRTLFRVETGSLRTSRLAELTALCGDHDGHLNDMIVTSDGHIYVGFDPDFQKYGFDSEAGAIIHVDPAGRAAVAAAGLHFPNGMVVTRDGSTLIVAETGRPRLTAFSRDADGALHDRRTWAMIEAGADLRPDRDRALLLEDVGLDGCAIDGDGHVWVANANSPACLRVAPGGRIVDSAFIPEGYRCLACAVGGEAGRTLLLCGLKLSPEGNLLTSRSHLFTVEFR